MRARQPQSSGGCTHKSPGLRAIKSMGELPPFCALSQSAHEGVVMTSAHASMKRQGRAAGTAPRAVRWFGILCVFICLVFAASGGAAVLCSFVPFAAVSERVRHISSSGQITFFTATYFRAMQLRLRTMGAVYILGAVLLFWLRPRLYRVVPRLAADYSMLWDDFRAAGWRTSRIDALALVAITTLAAAFRLPLLRQPMRYDEAFTFLQ